MHLVAHFAYLSGLRHDNSWINVDIST